jgi:two pore calcium channel protein
MLISFFFLMNIILAGVVNAYETACVNRQEENTRAAATNLKKAYQLMDAHETGTVDRETVMALFYILNEDFPEFRTLSNDDTKLLFAILDKDGSSTISEDEFMDFGNVLLLEFIKTSDYATFVEVRFPNFFKSAGYQRFCRIVKSSIFEKGVDAFLVLNAVVIGIQSYPELSGQRVVLDRKYWDGSIDTFWEFIETVFTLLYCLEVVVKITVNGWKAYSESLKNKFDFTITVLAVLASAYVYYPNDFADSRLIRLIIMARVLRLVRLLAAMKRFQLIGMICAEILPEAASVMLVLFFVMYLFAALGMQLYGGLVTRDPDNHLAYLILNTDFSANAYWANNFNDMFSGMNVLFNLLVVNNWTECEVGFEAVTQAKWVRLFFLAFHILGVVLVNNLVIAFIISSFLQQQAIFRERIDEEVVGNGEAVIRDRRALFNASTVTGTKTTLSGEYIARLRKGNSDLTGGHDRDRLRGLFTHNSSELEAKAGWEVS